jgi:hypothetical protein
MSHAWLIPQRTKESEAIEDGQIVLNNPKQWAAGNEDIISCWKLCVTLSTSTPLVWLERHGEISPGPKPPHKVRPSWRYGLLWSGGWRDFHLIWLRSLVKFQATAAKSFSF